MIVESAGKRVCSLAQRLPLVARQALRRGAASPSVSSDARLRQLHLSCFGVGILAEEEGGVPDGSHENTTAFIRNLQAERGAFVPIGAKEPKFHQFVSAKKLL